VTRVPAITAIINEAEATAAAPAAQPTCRRELDDCSKMPRKVAAKPPRNALRKAICLPISDKNSALIGGTVIYSGERRSHIGFRCTSESPAIGQRKAFANNQRFDCYHRQKGASHQRPLNEDHWNASVSEKRVMHLTRQSSAAASGSARGCGNGGCLLGRAFLAGVVGLHLGAIEHAVVSFVRFRERLRGHSVSARILERLVLGHGPVVIGIALFETGSVPRIGRNPFSVRDAPIVIRVARGKNLPSDEVTRFSARQLTVVIRVGQFETAFPGPGRSLGRLQILIRGAAIERSEKDREQKEVPS
jgi:hypothetical protein